VDEVVAARVETFAGRGGGDGVWDFAEPLACALFADLLGLDGLGLGARRRGLGLRPEPRRAWRAFFLDAIVRGRERPGDDLLSTLVAPAADGDRLTDEELVALLGLLLAAGVDTTRDFVANLLAELAARPEQWARIARDPGLVASAAEESLRYSSPIQAVFRTAMSDVDVGERTIPVGARVMLLFGSADRDERQWSDAGCFDVGRYAGGLAGGRSHVAFGRGPHACPGVWLTRRVGRGVLNALVGRGVRLVPAGGVQRGRNPCFRSVMSLPLRVRDRSD
jgi:cytochrome P450